MTSSTLNILTNTLRTMHAWQATRGTDLARGAAEKPGRFHPTRTHKASSAESILRHCLRSRGWSKAWREGRLTGRQHLELLQDVRLYSRAWLRHEAGGLFSGYITGLNDGGAGSPRAGGLGARSTPRVGEGITGGHDPGGTDDLAGVARMGRISAEDVDITRGLGASAASHLRRFFARAKQFVRESILAGVLALRGPGELDAGEIDAIDRSAAVQAEYFDQFHRVVAANPPIELLQPGTEVVVVEPAPMTPGQFIARAELYGNAPWQVQNIGRRHVLGQQVFARERRVHLLTIDEHDYCKTCITESRKGWVDLGTLNEIGDSECMGNCDCYFEWLSPDNEIHVSPWGRHNPYGHNQPGAQGTKLPGIAYPPDQPPPKPPKGEKPEQPQPPVPGWKDASGKSVPFELGPDVTKQQIPPGYTYEEAE